MTGGIDSFMEHGKLIITGLSTSGLSFTIHATRPNSEPLVFEGSEPGGQLTPTTEVDNYPDFPEGISGPELINNTKEQVERFGTETCHGIIEDVDASEQLFMVVLKNGDVYTADVLITAPGASTCILGIPGEENPTGYGLSTCATCDNVFFRGGKVMVISGGGATVEEANFLTKFASTVHLVCYRGESHTEDYWADRLMGKVGEGEIELMLNTEATELYGSPEEGVDHVTLVRNPEGHPSDKLDGPETGEFDFDVGAVFYAIGHMSNADYLDGISVQRDDDGHTVAKGGSNDGRTATDVPDILVAGDMIGYHYQ